MFLTFYDNFVPEEKVDFTEFEKEIASLDSLNKKDSINIRENNSSRETQKEITLFQFDPNNLSEDEWRKLGLSDKQIKTIKNYESKGGKFYKKEDLKKIYGISEAQYKMLEPYILIPPKEKKEYTSTKPKEENISSGKSAPIIELNTADSAKLELLPGIGGTLANRIIKYRNSLGGFTKKDQLLEVYGITKETYDKLVLRIAVRPIGITKININTAEVNDLKKHPYIKYNIANAIVNYRKAHGNYTSVAEIKKIEIVSDELYQKIEPYLTTE